MDRNSTFAEAGCDSRGHCETETVFLITAEDSLCYTSPVFQVGIVSKLDRNCCDISTFVKRQFWSNFKLSIEKVSLQCIVYLTLTYG